MSELYAWSFFVVMLAGKKQ